MSRRAKVITGTAVAVVLVAVAAVVWWLVRGDEPPAVDLQAAVAQLEDVAGDAGGTEPVGPEPEVDGESGPPAGDPAGDVGTDVEAEAPVAAEAGTTGDAPDVAARDDAGEESVVAEPGDGGGDAAPVAEDAGDVGTDPGVEAPVAAEAVAADETTSTPGGDTGKEAVAAAAEDGGAGAYPTPGGGDTAGEPSSEISSASGDESEVEAVGDAPSTGGGNAAAAVDEVESAGPAGLWKLVVTEGSDVLAGEGAVSFAGFRVQEVLAGGIGENTAVGRTAAVSGYIELTDTALVTTKVIIEMGTLRTDDSHRDHHMRESLNTEEFPLAAFTLAEPMELPPGSFEGDPFSGSAEGDLTIKGVTNRATFDLHAQLVGDVIVVVGSSEVVFSDYGVPTPRSAAVISVEDHGVMEFQLYFMRR